MAQVRNIYQTHSHELNRILQDIANRLDVLEGLRPDLDAGYYSLDTDKQLTTADPTSGYQTLVTGVEIAANSIKLSDGTLIIDNGTIQLTIGSSYGSIEIYDVNNTLIHKME